MRLRHLVSILGIAGCATAASRQLPGDIDARDDHGHVDAADIDAAMHDDPDAPEGHPDAAEGHPDASVDASTTPDANTTPDAGQTGAVSSLLLSEVALAPSEGEFIEIVNPTASAVPLDHFYLSDNGTYWRLPDGSEAIDDGDFIAAFPSGATIPAHGVITVAMATAAAFKTSDGVDATYSVADGTIKRVDTNQVAAGLTNNGEMVVLFYWDGTSDLVTDVDVMIAGKVAGTNNGLVDKSGALIDGPDADTAKSTYKTDMDTMAGQPSAPPSGKSTKRVALEPGHEKQTGGGNGSGGDDETSEATGTTWDTAFTLPTPGVVPSALVP